MSSVKYTIPVEHTCTACAINGVEDDIECEVCQGMVHYHESATIPEAMVNKIKADGIREAMSEGRAPSNRNACDRLYRYADGLLSG